MYHDANGWHGHDLESRMALGRDQSRDVLCFARKSQIFDQHARQRAIFKVESGVVRLSTLLPDGRRQIVRFVFDGGFLEHSISDAHAFSAEALCDVRVRLLTCDEFAARLKNPAFMRELHESLAGELAATQAHLIVLGRASPEEKVAWFILEVRDETVDREDPIVPLHMTRADIADYLGLTLETVSRIFTRFAREGVWCLSKQAVEICNLGRLKTIARGIGRRPSSNLRIPPVCHEAMQDSWLS